MTIEVLAQWFIEKNPELQRGHIDDNIKLNQLLYLTHLMYYAVNNEKLTDNQFVKHNC